MKFLTLLSLATSATALTGWIAAPSLGQEVAVGEQITVDFKVRIPATATTPVGIIIGLAPYSNVPLSSIGVGQSQVVGTLLYSGGYEWAGYAPEGGALYTNYTVTIPASFPTGSAALSVAYLTVTGASWYSSPYLEIATTNVTVTA